MRRYPTDAPVSDRHRPMIGAWNREEGTPRLESA